MLSRITLFGSSGEEDKSPLLSICLSAYLQLLILLLGPYVSFSDDIKDDTLHIWILIHFQLQTGTPMAPSFADAASLSHSCFTKQWWRFLKQGWWVASRASWKRRSWQKQLKNVMTMCTWMMSIQTINKSINQNIVTRKQESRIDALVTLTIHTTHSVE